MHSKFIQESLAAYHIYLFTQCGDLKHKFSVTHKSVMVVDFFLQDIFGKSPRPLGVEFLSKTFFWKVKWKGRGGGVEEESCDTKEPEKRRLIGREENVEKKGKGKEGGFGRFGADILH